MLRCADCRRAVELVFSFDLTFAACEACFSLGSDRQMINRLHRCELPCATLHNTALHYTTLHYTTLHYTTLHYTAM